MQTQPRPAESLSQESRGLIRVAHVQGTPLSRIPHPDLRPVVSSLQAELPNPTVPPKLSSGRTSPDHGPNILATDRGDGGFTSTHRGDP